MGENRGKRWVNADCQVIGDIRHNIGLQVTDPVAVIDNLVVSDDKERLNALVLQAYPIRQRPEVVTDMQAASRTVPGKNAPLVRMDRQISLDLVTASLGTRQSGGVRANPGGVAGHRC